jgi:hyperosmotically inducible periplasmic protein
MPRKLGAIGLAALGLALAVGAWGAAQEPKDLPPTPPPQQPKGTGEAIGDTVDNVLQSIKRGARATTESLQEQYQRARTAVHNMGVQARVYSRLHWDKDLFDAKIDLEFKEGTATLRGTVKNLQAKAKAISLARDTVGVDRVDEHLTIEPDSPANEAGPAEKNKT